MCSMNGDRFVVLTQKFIIDLFENAGLIKDLEDMLSSFVLYVAKKKWQPTSSNQVQFFTIC